MRVFQLPVARPVPPVPSETPSVSAAVCIRASILTAAMVWAALLGAQTRPDTVTITMLRATHPWLTGTGSFADVQRMVRDGREAVRDRCEELELVVSDQMWPLPTYRAMLFPA